MKPEYDVERISAIVGDMRRYCSDLGELGIAGPADLDDKRTFYAVSMILFALLNRTIDLWNEIVLARGLGVPSTYREIFTLLEKGAVIDSGLATRISRLVFYRNLLSHEYHGIDQDKIFSLISRISDIREFEEAVQHLVGMD